MDNHYYEINVKSHTFVDEDELEKLKGIIEDFFDIDNADSTQHVEAEHVDSEYL